MALRIVERASLTDVGRQRQSNEDSYLERSPVFAVADGMGGAQAGEVASRIAVGQFAEGPATERSPEEQLAHIAREANRKIYRMAQSDSSRAGMGTTLTAVMVRDHELSVGHVGDSRLYRLRDEELERLTHDHSLVEEFVRQGKLSPEAAENHPQRSVITRALGPEPEVDVDTCTYPARGGDVYLLCSDGLTAMVPESRVAEILRGRSSLEQAARQLVDAANESGGRDNITVVLFRLDVDEAADQEEEADTLSGRETGPLDADSVRAAVAGAEREAAEEGRPQRAARGAAAADDSTVVLGSRQADEARAASAPRQPTRIGGLPGGDPGVPTGPSKPPAGVLRPATARRRRRGARAVTAAVVVLVIGAVAAGFYYGSRQFFFLGTNEQGLVTLYRGLPYELPLSIELYEEEYVSAVPAARGATLRRDIVEHRLHSRGDAVDLIRKAERGQLESVGVRR